MPIIDNRKDVAEGMHRPQHVDVEKRFLLLAAEWREAIGPLSSATKIVQHPAYRGIIELGGEVVPFILRDLEQKPDHWFAALRAITGEDPVTPEDHGRIDKMAIAWVNSNSRRPSIT